MTKIIGKIKKFHPSFEEWNLSIIMKIFATHKTKLSPLGEWEEGFYFIPQNTCKTAVLSVFR